MVAGRGGKGRHCDGLRHQARRPKCDRFPSIRTEGGLADAASLHSQALMVINVFSTWQNFTRLA